MYYCLSLYFFGIYTGIKELKMEIQMCMLYKHLAFNLELELRILETMGIGIIR